jgi:hypothetical protein
LVTFEALVGIGEWIIWGIDEITKNVRCLVDVFSAVPTTQWFVVSLVNLHIKVNYKQLVNDISGIIRVKVSVIRRRSAIRIFYQTITQVYNYIIITTRSSFTR